ncbi:MAG: hypothetical protein DWQ53_17880 [Microcystis flos-aquae DF17]|jgi:hypothetical protein|nr:MAG: hypothetical protein DWQ53_17880 [Microcystis flos-aquae DF17]
MVCKYFDIVIAFLPQQAFEVGEGKCQRSQAGNAYDQEVGRVYDIGVLAGITGHSLLLKAQRVR